MALPRLPLINRGFFIQERNKKQRRYKFATNALLNCKYACYYTHEHARNHPSHIAHVHTTQLTHATSFPNAELVGSESNKCAIRLQIRLLPYARTCTWSSINTPQLTHTTSFPNAELVGSESDKCAIRLQRAGAALHLCRDRTLSIRLKERKNQLANVFIVGQKVFDRRACKHARPRLAISWHSMSVSVCVCEQVLI